MKTGHLRNSGGSFQMTGDYSITPEDFAFQNNQKSTPNYVHRLVLVVEDAGIFKAEDYGALPVLPNGVLLQHQSQDGETLLDLLDEEILKQNSCIIRNFSNPVITDLGGVNNIIRAEMNFVEMFGKPLKLDVGEKIVATCRDNLTGLLRHMIKTYYN